MSEENDEIDFLSNGLRNLEVHSNESTSRLNNAIRKLTPEQLYQRHLKLVDDCKTLSSAEQDQLLIFNIKPIFAEMYSQVKIRHKASISISEEAYLKSFKILQMAEFMYAEIEMHRYDKQSVLVRRIETDKSSYNKLVFRNLSNSDATIIPVISYLLLTSVEDGRHFLCHVNKVDGDFISFKSFHQARRLPYLQALGTLDEGQYDVRILSSSIMLRRSLTAIEDFVGNAKLLRSLFSQSLEPIFAPLDLLDSTPDIQLRENGIDIALV